MVRSPYAQNPQCKGQGASQVILFHNRRQFLAVTPPKGKVEYPAGNLAPDQLEAGIIVRFMRNAKAMEAKPLHIPDTTLPRNPVIN